MPTALRDHAHALFREADNAASKLREAERQQEIERATKRFAALFRKQGREFMARFDRLAAYFHEAAADRDIGDAFAEIFAVTREEADDALARSLMGGLNLGYAAEASKFGIEAAFKLKPERAVAWARANAAARVTKINSTTEETIRRIVIKGIDEGKSYGEVAREIKGRFDEFAVGQPQHHIRSRAELVAVTENAHAYESGTRVLVDEVREAGIDMEKYWSNTGDDLVSDGCLDNTAAGWIPVDRDFPSGDQHPPRFPSCRCACLYRMRE